MHLCRILGILAPLTILIAHTSISVANPVPTSAASAIKIPQPLSKRTNHVTLSGMTLRGSQPFAFILPVQLAVSQFESFYKGLYFQAISQLHRNSPGSPSFSLRYSIFEISFVADNVEQVGIPWEFVRDFAVMMRIMALRGYTGCYDQGYWNEVGNFGIYVGLRISAPLSGTPPV